jgi:hypothetical protein
VTEQRRGRRIALTSAEIDEYLDAQRTCRVATLTVSGAPHVAPMWFYWDSTALWLNSIVTSQRWSDLQRDGRVAIVIDDGEAYAELRGVEIKGTVEIVGEVPRLGDPVAELVAPELGFHRKYRDPSTALTHDGKHAWLRVVPQKITSWDFTKMSNTAHREASK